MKLNDGGPAFPCSGDDDSFANNGMSLRDWFAGQALFSLLTDWPERASRQCAVMSYIIADDMLKAREQHGT